MTGFLKGTATALITPFDEKGVNERVLSELIEAQISGGVDAIVVLGTTGEPSTMTDEERDIVISCAVNAAAGRMKVIVGTGSNCTERAVQHSKRAQALGADGILSVTPYYNRCTQDGLYEYYRMIAEAVTIPVICYNVPARTGVNLLPETMGRVAQIPNVAGIKEASGNMAQVMETLRTVRGQCDVYSGEDTLNLPILACGGSAVISVAANLVPKKVSALTRAALEGEYSLARTLSDELFPLVKACFSEVNPIPVKEGLNLLGFNAGLPRPPLTPLTKANKEALKEALASFGGTV